MKNTFKKVQVKKWLLDKNDLLAYCSSDIINGYRYEANHMFPVIHETEKAYQISTDKKGNFWIPKSQVLKVEESEILSREQKTINEDIRELEYNVRNSDLNDVDDIKICEILYRKIITKHHLSEDETTRVNKLMSLLK